MQGEFLLAQVDGLQKSLNYATKIINEVWLVAAKTGLWTEESTVDDLPGMMLHLAETSVYRDLLAGYRYESMSEDKDRVVHQLTVGAETMVFMPSGSLRGAVIVEGEADAMACAAVHQDVMVIALGTSRGWVSEELRRRLIDVPVILVALPVDKTELNPEVMRVVNVWLREYRQAKFWPVLSGRDPVEFAQEYGGDLEKWIEAGLPPRVVAGVY